MLRYLFLLSLLLPFHAAAQEARLTPAQLRADLATMGRHLAEIHPDPGFDGQGPAIAGALAAVQGQLTRPMTRTEAWRVLATLNPAFADGHMQVFMPHGTQRARAHLAAGGKLFPFEVIAASDGTLRIRSALGGGATPYAGARLLRINGVPAQEMGRSMLARTAGDTAQLRANLLSWSLWLTYWKEGVLPYLASAPYRHTSAYVKKVIAGRASPEEPLGSVIRADHHKWEQPDLANPLRFTGRTYVLTGRRTYSSAVLFANVMQDFGFGKLVGEPGSARTRQSGGTQYRTLPHTGLELVLPRFILERPAGPRTDPLLAPDIVLADDPLQPRALVTALLAWHREHAQ